MHPVASLADSTTNHYLNQHWCVTDNALRTPANENRNYFNPFWQNQCYHIQYPCYIFLRSNELKENAITGCALWQKYCYLVLSVKGIDQSDDVKFPSFRGSFQYRKSWNQISHNLAHSYQSLSAYKSWLNFAQSTAVILPYGSMTAVLCAKFKQDWMTEEWANDSQNFMRFEFIQINHIATQASSHKMIIL